MSSEKKDTKKIKRQRPSMTPEGRNEQIIAAAVNLAEQKILDGTASSQIICHYLKMASEREKKELIKLDAENELLKAKKKAIDSEGELASLYNDVIKAMKKYTGNKNDEH